MPAPLTEKDIVERGWSLAIFRAIKAAGGPLAVAYHLGLTNAVSVQHWYRRGSMPPENIVKLVELSGGAVTEREILDDIARISREKREQVAV